MINKILVFHPIIAPYRIDFFNSLAERYDTTVCLFWRNLIDQTFDYQKIEEQFKFKPLYLVKNEIGFWMWLKNIWSQLRSMDRGIVITPEFGSVTAIALLYRFLFRAKYKVVTMVDDSYQMISEDQYFSWSHKKAMSILLPHIDEVINVEEKVASWYRQHYNKGFFFPIICDDSIAIERQKKVLYISNSYVEQYKLDGKKVLLFVGRLVKLKNVSSAINAFIDARIEDTVFVIVGSGVEEKSLKELAKGQNNIIFTGRLEGDALYAWYNIASVFTLPSIQEPFGAVTNEALVAGCKVLISKNAGSQCLVGEKVNGYVIDPNDREMFVKRLKALMEESPTIHAPLMNRASNMNCTFLERFDALCSCFEKNLINLK